MRTRSDRPAAKERAGSEQKATQLGHHAGAPSPEVEPRPKPRAQDPEHPVVRGDVVSGRYRIEGEIGRGGMGAVYRATQLVTNKPVAIKWLFQRGSRFEERRRRFFREARAVAMVRHPNVADVYDFGEHESSLYMVMELLEGESLRARLRRGVLGEAEAVSLLMPALRGLAAAHAQGVIHRDIKPENVFLCERESGVLPEAVLLDFGLSKVADPLLEQSVLTLAGALIGTPQYMAPEQADGRNLVDARCDVYAMAILLYEAVSGRRQFLAYSTENLLSQLMQDDPTPLRNCAPHISEAFERAVMRALSRDPAERQPDVETLARELEGLGQVPFAAGPRLSSFRPERLVRSNPPPQKEPTPALPLGKSVLTKWWFWAALGLLALLTGLFLGSRASAPAPPSPPVSVRVPEPVPRPAERAAAPVAPTPPGELPKAKRMPSEPAPATKPAAAKQRAASNATADEGMQPEAAPARAAQTRTTESSAPATEAPLAEAAPTEAVLSIKPQPSEPATRPTDPPSKAVLRGPPPKARGEPDPVPALPLQGNEL